MRCQLNAIGLVSILLALAVVLTLLFRNIVSRYAYACCYEEDQSIEVRDFLWAEVSELNARTVVQHKTLDKLVSSTAVDSIARLTSFVDDTTYIPPKHIVDWKLIEPKGHDRAASIVLTSNGLVWISFRGTVTKSEWLDIDLQKGYSPIGNRSCQNACQCHRGITDYYNNDLRVRILDVLNARQYKDKINGIVVCGHSLGGGLSIVCTADMVLDNSPFPRVPITTIAIAPPRVCSLELSERLTHMNSTLTRGRRLNIKLIINTSDIVPDAPSAVTPDMSAFRHKTMFRYQHPSQVFTFNKTKESLLLSHSLVTYKEYIDSL